MITINNKEYRNLVEQVGYLTDRVDEHYERDRVLADFGIRVVGSVNSVDQLPNPVAYDGLYGDAYTVGTGAPYDFYIFTRPLQGETANRWLDLGQLAIEGPEGPEGPKGDKGDTGESTQWYVGQGVPYLEADVNSLYFDTTTANIYQKQVGQWVLVANIKGNTGAQGPQGPQGERGEQGLQGIQGANGVPGDAVTIVGILTSSSMLPDPDTVARDTAYVVQDETGQWLYFITGLGTEASPLIWDRVAFENGTTVLVGGNPVQTFDADTKVSIKRAPSQGSFHLYRTNYQGTTSTIGLDTGECYAQSGGAGGNVPQYYDNSKGTTAPLYQGKLLTNDPVNDYHAANKKYVDEQVQGAKDASVAHQTSGSGVTRAYVVSSGVDGARTIAHTYNFTNSGNLVQYFNSAYGGTEPAVDGYLLCRTPTKDYHAATKKYVDDAIAAKPHITEQFKFMTDTSAGSDGVGLSSYYAMDNTHITFEAIPLDVNLSTAGMTFSTSTGTAYRKLEFFKSTDVLQSNAPWCRGTLVDGTVSYFQPTTSLSKIIAKSGPVLLTVTVSPITAIS